MNTVKSLIEKLKPTLIHDIEYYEYSGQDRNHKPTFKESISIKHCRLDMTRTYEVSKSTESETVTAVLFMYNGATEPFVPILEKSKVIHKGKAYKVYKLVECYEPYRNSLFSYEVELVPYA